MNDQNQANALECTAAIVTAFVAHNSVRPEDLPEILSSVHAALLGTTEEPEAVAEPEKPEPRIPIKKTIKPGGLVSLEDGKTYRTLKRHLSTHGLSPDGYRAKWGLPRDYPMVCSEYTAKRSELAKAAGLGVKAPRK